MSSEALFIRTDTPNGVQFDVTPASQPAGTNAVLALGGGCRGLFTGAVLGLLAAIPIYLVASIFLGGLATLVSFVVACGIVVLFTIKTAGKYRTVNPKPHPTRLVVNPAGIQHPGGFVNADDIAELALRHPNDKGGYTISSYVSDSAAYNAGQRLGMELKNRTFALMVRRKSISTPEIIVRGLTWNAGEALLNDIRIAMT